MRCETDVQQEERDRQNEEIVTLSVYAAEIRYESEKDTQIETQSHIFHPSKGALLPDYKLIVQAQFAYTKWGVRAVGITLCRINTHS